MTGREGTSVKVKWSLLSPLMVVAVNGIGFGVFISFRQVNTGSASGDRYRCGRVVCRHHCREAKKMFQDAAAVVPSRDTIPAYVTVNKLFTVFPTNLGWSRSEPSPLLTGTPLDYSCPPRMKHSSPTPPGGTTSRRRVRRRFAQTRAYPLRA